MAVTHSVCVGDIVILLCVGDMALCAGDIVLCVGDMVVCVCV